MKTSHTSSRRSERFATLVKRHASTLIQFEFDEFSSVFVTITDAEVSSDLRNVKILYSVYGGDEEKQQAKELFKRYASRFRYELGNRIEWRFVPVFTFAYDESIEHAARLEALIHEVEKEHSEEGEKGEDSQKTLNTKS